jgi:osmoprotectant transport system ATP-binding protein
MITFEDVVKIYPGGSTAVDHLSMELPTGKMTVLVGPSGCGKTTSLRMINRMVQPTSGRILIDGRDVAGQDEALLRRGIGYVIQHAGLFPHKTVLDNVATVPLLLGKTRREARAAALELLERVGLAAEFAGRYPAQLSGGQQQRVGVARALAADPPVMLMDEPFSAVDPVVREGLHREFLRLQQDLGKTIAMVTHDIDEAIKLGDRVAVFRQGGHLAQFGTPQELLEQPVDDFVAEFVGRDRGLRSLSFDTAADLPVSPLTDGGAELVLDEAGRPVGWRRGGVVEPTAGVFTKADSLRMVTDLAIMSPVGVAVRVGADGTADGLVRHHDLVDFLATRRDRRAAEHEA